MITNMTEGNPLKHILLFSLPLLVGNVFQQIYNIADTVIVARTIGTNALGAVAASGAIVFMVFCFSFGMTGGFTIITAQRFGAGDMSGMRRSVFTGLVLTLAAIAAVSALSLPTAAYALEFLETPPSLMEDAVAYLRIIYYGIGPIALYNLLAGYIRALGDSRSPLIFLAAATVLNIVLDLYFIKSLGWGIAGAAWATVIAQTLSGVACFVYVLIKFPVLHLHKEDIVWNWGFALEHLRVGTPMAAQFIVIAIGLVILQAGVNSLGADAVVAIGAAGRVQQLVIQPLISLGVAMATFTAQNYGAGKTDRIVSGVRRTLLVSFCVSILSSALLWIFAEEITMVFVEAWQREVIDLAVKYLHIITVPVFILGFLFIYRNSLQGMGRTFVPFLSSVVELAARMAVVFCLIERYGFTGACFVEPAAWIGATLILGSSYYTVIYRLRRGESCQLACREALDVKG